MPRRTAGAFALALIGASAALSVFAATRDPVTVSAATGGLALDAPLPTRIPPGTTLTIGDPMTRKVLEHTGWIKDVPFNIRWAEISGGPSVNEAFHAKVLDVGSAMNIPPIHAVWIGIPVKMVAVRLRHDWQDHPTFQLAIAPRAKIDSLADLRGKRIAYSPGQAQGEIVLRVLRSQGLKPSDVTLVEVPSTAPDAYINALVGGMVDAAPIGAGAPAKRYLDNYAREGAKTLKHGERDDFLILYVREETLRDPAKAAALREYVKLWARALAWQDTHRDEWARVYYQENQGLSAADARHVVETAGHVYTPADWSDAITLEQGSIELMASETGRKPFDAATLFDRRFEPIVAEAFAQAQSAPPAAAAVGAGR